MNTYIAVQKGGPDNCRQYNEESHWVAPRKQKRDMMHSGKLLNAICKEGQGNQMERRYQSKKKKLPDWWRVIAKCFLRAAVGGIAIEKWQVLADVSENKKKGQFENWQDWLKCLKIVWYGFVSDRACVRFNGRNGDGLLIFGNFACCDQHKRQLSA